MNILQGISQQQLTFWIRNGQKFGLLLVFIFQDFDRDALEKFIESSGFPTVVTFDTSPANQKYLLKYFDNAGTKVRTDNWLTSHSVCLHWTVQLVVQAMIASYHVHTISLSLMFYFNVLLESIIENATLVSLGLIICSF